MSKTLTIKPRRSECLILNVPFVLALKSPAKAEARDIASTSTASARIGFLSVKLSMVAAMILVLAAGIRGGNLP
jgi:hypothetical protein